MCVLDGWKSDWTKYIYVLAHLKVRLPLHKRKCASRIFGEAHFNFKRNVLILNLHSVLYIPYKSSNSHSIGSSI